MRPNLYYCYRSGSQEVLFFSFWLIRNGHDSCCRSVEVALRSWLLLRVFSQVLARITVTIRQSDHTHPAGIIITIRTVQPLLRLTTTTTTTTAQKAYSTALNTRLQQVYYNTTRILYNIIIIILCYCSVVQTFVQGPYVYTCVLYTIDYYYYYYYYHIDVPRVDMNIVYPICSYYMNVQRRYMNKNGMNYWANIDYTFVMYSSV